MSTHPEGRIRYCYTPPQDCDQQNRLGTIILPMGAARIALGYGLFKPGHSEGSDIGRWVTKEGARVLGLYLPDEAKALFTGLACALRRDRVAEPPLSEDLRQGIYGVNLGIRNAVSEAAKTHPGEHELAELKGSMTLWLETQVIER